MTAQSQAIGAASTIMLALAAAAAMALEPGEWKQTDTKAGGLTVIAEPFLTDMTPGGQLNGAFLAIRCREGRTTVEIIWGGKSKRKTHLVNFAVDDLPPWQETWVIDDESKMLLGLRENKSAIDFLNRVFPSEVLTLQFRTNYRISAYSYRMLKAEPYLRAVASRCGWMLQ